MVSRSEDKAQAAVAEIKSITGNDKVEFIKLDLLSLKSVKQIVDQFKIEIRQVTYSIKQCWCHDVSLWSQ